MTGQDAGSLDAAVASARGKLGLDAQEPARTWSVASIEAGASGFVLVVFGSAQRASAVAAVDPVSGEVLEAARLPGRESHTPISADEAMSRAGVGSQAQARLVWGPSPASRSRFYPIWELRTAERTVWVDSVRGVVWDTLEAPLGGGSSGGGDPPR